MQLGSATAEAVWQYGLLTAFLSALAIGTLFLMRFSSRRYSKLSTNDKPLYIKRYLEGEKMVARFELPIVRYLIRVASIVLFGAIVATIVGLLF
jgi:hypothetical protein